MVYLSTTVVQGSGGRVLLLWEIVQCHSKAITIHDFFITILLPRLGLSEVDDEPEVRSEQDVINIAFNGQYGTSLMCLSEAQGKHCWTMQMQT